MARAHAQGVSAADDLYARFTFGSAVLFLGLEVAYILAAQRSGFAKPPIDNGGFAVGRDFINSWMSGRAAFSGGPAAWFDLSTYNEVLRNLTGRPDFPVHFWSYPPHLLLFTVPLGLLPYVPAYVLWCLVGLALYLFAAWSGGASIKHMLFLAFAPAVLVNAFFGQNGCLTAALLIGGLANLDRRPLFAGILFGILTIKPQFGMLLPIVLLLTGRWRVIAAAVATTAVLMLATSIWFGIDVWPAYFREVMPHQNGLIADSGNFNWPMVASAFANARRIGLSADTAWAVQAISSGAAVAMVIWAFWRRRDAVLANALLVTATFLFSPWMLNYDMVVFGFFLARLRERADNTAADHALILLLWALPLVMMPLGVAHVPIAMLVLPAFAGRLVWRLSQSDARQAAGGDFSVAPLAALAARTDGLAPERGVNGRGGNPGRGQTPATVMIPQAAQVRDVDAVSR